MQKRSSQHGAGHAGWFDDGDSVLSDIKITPLVDVALVLLIIFMITAPMMVQGANVRLPETRPMENLPQGRIIVSVNAEGQTFVNDNEVPTERLVERLTPMSSGAQGAYLRADRSLDWGTVMNVLEQVRRAGFVDVGLVIEPRVDVDA